MKNFIYWKVPHENFDLLFPTYYIILLIYFIFWKQQMCTLLNSVDVAMDPNSNDIVSDMTFWFLCGAQLNPLHRSQSKLTRCIITSSFNVKFIFTFVFTHLIYILRYTCSCCQHEFFIIKPIVLKNKNYV